MKHIIIIFLLVNVSFSGFSQEEAFKVKEVIHKDGYDYIPLEFMKDSLDGLVGFRHFDSISGDGKSKVIEIDWNSSCTDGRFILVVTPEQIYMRSGHNNPNPNRFYWVLPIDSSIYASIERTLRKSEVYSFDKRYDDEHVLKYEGEELEKKCDELLKSQILKYFKVFNKTIAANKLSYEKIIFPSELLFYNIDIERLKRIIIKRNVPNR